MTSAIKSNGGARIGRFMVVIMKVRVSFLTISANPGSKRGLSGLYPASSRQPNIKNISPLRGQLASKTVLGGFRSQYVFIETMKANIFC